ncbi:histidine kinase N-terminal 7TM domain-containing protein [Chloroflexota bacterium]
MINGWMDTVLAGLQTINQILTAGIAITAFSLFLYSLSFNLRDRVARSFAIILLCVVIVFTAEALQDNSITLQTLDLLMRLQWFGLVFLPAAYLHLSDALLVTAGRPSRGRRRVAVRGMYVIASIFLALLAFGYLLGPIVPDGKPAPYLQRTAWTEVFTVFYVTAMVWAGINFYRAYSLMLTRSGRRRMIYLMAGATAPALGSYPYLLFGYALAAQHQLLFWSVATIINILVGALVIVMAYAVAFFGVSWPDRVIKTRLFKWIMRGPVTASVTLGWMTVVRRGGQLLGTPYSAFVPFTVVASVLLMEHAITFAAPLWERWLFYGRDRGELELLQNVEERLLTQGDLQQFLESVLAAVRDHLQAPSAFVAALDDETLLPVVAAGNRALLEEDNLIEALEQINGDVRHEFLWGNYWVLPLYSRRRSEMDRDELPPLLGLLGVARNEHQAEMEHDQRESLWLLADRAALALEDRQLQQRVFRSLADIQPQVEMIQRMRAASRYDANANLLNLPLPQEADLANWVKDALTHYWGGPKFTNNPLTRLQVVRELADQEDGNVSNALRALLRRAVDEIKPQGDRKFTTEWLLYNILEMKFIEGRKVRDVASRLAMSEADLYRKQRIAIEVVAKAILEMEVNQQGE